MACGILDLSVNYYALTTGNELANGIMKQEDKKQPQQQLVRDGDLVV